MNLDRARVVLRPRSLAEVLDLACLICFNDALGLYVRLGALLLLPAYAGCMVLRYLLHWNWWLVWLVAAGAVTLIQGVFTTAAGRYLFAEALDVREVLRAFGRRLPSYLWALLLSRLYMGLAAAFFFVPLAFVWTRMVYVHEACLLEMSGGTAATQRSNRFGQGGGASPFQVLVGLLLAQVGCVIATELLCDGVVDAVLQLGKPFGSLWRQGGSPYALLGFMLSVPYVTTTRFLMYIDERTRADGWDIQLRFLALVSKAEQARGTA